MNDSAVSQIKKQALAKRMQDLGLRKQDFDERFILGSGKGGQKVNKTSNCVFLRHPPSGLEIKCGQSRSRELNRFLARRALCDRLEERLHNQISARAKAAAKIRRQKCRRSRRAREHMLAGKHIQAGKKQNRRQPEPED